MAWPNPFTALWIKVSQNETTISCKDIGNPTFMVFDICEGEDDSYRLVPCGLYKTTDISLKNNLLPKNFTFESQRYSKKVSDFLTGIKHLEERFYERGEIIH